MLNSLRNNSVWGTRLKGVVAAVLLAGSGAATAATVSVDLCATTNSAYMLPAKGPGNTVVQVGVPILGYTLAPTCAPNTATAPLGAPIVVNAGDTVNVTLRSALAKNTGLLFQGQAMVPDTTGIAAGGTKTYSFVATNPGTFLYEAAPIPGTEYQAAMGLHGALIVLPALPVRNDTGVTVTLASDVVSDAAALATDLGLGVSGAGIPPGTVITAVIPGVSFTMSAAATADGTAVTVTLPTVAYDTGTSYDSDAVLVLSEIDTALNTRSDPSTFDMRGFAAKYFLINGQPHPYTAPINAAAGKNLLLRYVNAGVKHHSMAVLGLRQNFVAKDAATLPTLRHNVAAETLAAGQTGDAIITIPASATTASSFAVYDANLAFNNSDARGFGGMLTFINAGAGTAVAGPVSNSLLLNPSITNGSVALALSATINSAASTVTAAEYFMVTKGTDGTGTAMSGTFGTATVAASATIAASALPTVDGTYSVYVHGKDATGAWGAATTVALKLDRVAPTTTIGTSGLSPNPSNGAVSVSLTATANDAATGNSNIVAAEYSVDGGAAVPMSVISVAPTTTVLATIPSGLAAGAHTVTVRSMDAAGNWSALASTTLTVQTAPPVTSGVSVAKSPNNGTVPLSVTQPVVRVGATLASAGSTVAGAEGFICSTAGATTCTIGAVGSGFPFVPTDGAWGGASEAAYADIPLATIAALTNGNHAILVRGKDASGNWGPTVATTLLIDKTAPTISSATLSAGTIVFGEASTTLTLVSSDVGTSVIGGQYWIDGTATPPTNATAFTGNSVVINTSALAAGTHTVRVRVQDAATNWSAVTSVTLNVIRAVNDTLSFTANTSTNSQQNNQVAPGVLANDQPIGGAGRTATLVSGPVRTGGTGTGTIAVTCGAGPATGVCANGSYRVTLTPATSTIGTVRQQSKRGTYQFTYTETLNGVTTLPATVTITVN